MIQEIRTSARPQGGLSLQAQEQGGEQGSPVGQRPTADVGNRRLTNAAPIANKTQAFAKRWPKARIPALARGSSAGRESENARVQAEADRYNEQPGALNIDHTDAWGNLVRGDGIDCEACLNRGSVYVVLTDEDGVARRYFKQCECMKRRLAVRRIQASGMERALQRYTFAAFKTDEHWQAGMKQAALDYLQEGVKEGAWLYIGGQSGCGKTHICTAACGVMLRKLAVRYMAWPHEAQRIKAVANDAEQYAALVKPLQEAEVLYLDDFLKPLKGRDGSDGNATAADLRLAFDILNARYINQRPTIISSEWFSHELGALDEAIAGRICEMSGPWKVDVGRDAGRNWRMKGNVI